MNFPSISTDGPHTHSPELGDGAISNNGQALKKRGLFDLCFGKFIKTVGRVVIEPI